jgi:hypothetical protein
VGDAVEVGVAVGVGAGVLTEAAATGVFSVFCSGTDLPPSSGLLCSVQDTSARQTIKNSAYLKFIYRNAPLARKCFLELMDFRSVFLIFVYNNIIYSFAVFTRIFLNSKIYRSQPAPVPGNELPRFMPV